MDKQLKSTHRTNVAVVGLAEAEVLTPEGETRGRCCGVTGLRRTPIGVISRKTTKPKREATFTVVVTYDVNRVTKSIFAYLI